MRPLPTLPREKKNSKHGTLPETKPHASSAERLGTSQLVQHTKESLQGMQFGDNLGSFLLICPQGEKHGNKMKKTF